MYTKLIIKSIIKKRFRGMVEMINLLVHFMDRKFSKRMVTHKLNVVPFVFHRKAVALILRLKSTNSLLHTVLN